MTSLSKGMIVLAVLALFVFAWFRKVPRPQPASAVTVDDPSLGVRQELGDLKREVARLEFERIAEKASVTTVSAVSAPVDPPLTLEQRDELSKQQLIRWKVFLESAIQRQTRDSAWAAETERKIRSVTDALPTGTALKRTTCAESMCEVVLKHEDIFQQRELGRKIGVQDPFTSGSFYSYDGLETTVFVTREGRILPQPEE